MTDRFTLRTKLLLVSLIFFSAISVFYFMHSQHNPIGADFFIGLRDGIIGTTVGIWFFGLIFLSVRKRRLQQQGLSTETKHQILLATGFLSMLCGIWLNRFGEENEVYAGTSMIFFLISAVTNLIYIHKIRTGRTRKSELE